MADLDIERKRPTIWPWIVGLIILALIIWAVLELLNPDVTTPAGPTVTGMAAQPASPASPAWPGAAPPAGTLFRG